MDTKGTLESTCRKLESKYQVPEDFKVRIREILEPLFRHDLSADEILVIERALERTYHRHVVPEADTPSGVAEVIVGPHADSGHSGPGAGEIPPPAADPARPRAVTTGVPSATGGKGGVLLVKIDPKTKTAQLIRLSAEEVKVLANKAILSDFLKEPDDDTIVH